MRRVERAGGGALLTLGAAVAPARSGQTRASRELWSPALAKRTAMLWILWFGIVFTYYGIFLYVPVAARGTRALRGAKQRVLLPLDDRADPRLLQRRVARGALGPQADARHVSARHGGGGVPVRNRGHRHRSPSSALALLSFFNLGAWGVVYTYSPGALSDRDPRDRGGNCGRGRAYRRDHWSVPHTGDRRHTDSSARPACSSCSWSCSCDRTQRVAAG